MRLLTGTRIGQSSQELRLAVLFSFILHVVFLFGGILFAMLTTPKIDVPPVYDVALVSETADLPAIPQQQPEPVPEEPKKTEQQKAKTETPPAAKKGEMPGLEKKKKIQEEELPGKSEVKTESRPAGSSVVVTASSQGFKFPPYDAIIRNKIDRHWNPPPGPRLMKATIAFSIIRSGRVGEVRLQMPSGNFYFDQAAMRAVQSASPFPPLPEAFFKGHVEYTVDLMREE